MEGIKRFGDPLLFNPGQLNKATVAMIKDKDTDGDNTLNQDELGLDKDVFTKVDANGDGKADREELNAYYPMSKVDLPTLGLIKEKDTDGDKALNAQELGVSGDILAEIDSNGDGKTDRDELNAAHPLGTVTQLGKNLLDLYQINASSSNGFNATL